MKAVIIACVFLAAGFAQATTKTTRHHLSRQLMFANKMMGSADFCKVGSDIGSCTMRVSVTHSETVVTLIAPDKTTVTAKAIIPDGAEANEMRGDVYRSIQLGEVEGQPKVTLVMQEKNGQLKLAGLIVSELPDGSEIVAAPTQEHAQAIESR